MAPKVLCVGSGGVGAIAALALTLNERSETTLVVRSDYDQVLKNGYTIRSITYGDIDNWKPQHISKSVEDAQRDFGPFDYIVLTTKNIPDGAMTCEEIIRPAVSAETTIVLIQNGIGIEEPMIKEFPGHVILSGISLIGSSNIDCVVRNSHKDYIFLSPFENPTVPADLATQKVHEFTKIYQDDEKKRNEIEIEESSKRSRWGKLVYNSVMNTICAIVEQDVNRCQMVAHNDELFGPAMDEVVAIAASQGVDLGDAFKEKFLHIGDGLFYSPSMAIDIQKNQLIELEVILGNPLKYARANSVSTPILSTIYKLLKMKQFKLKEQKGLIKVNEDDFKGKDSNLYPDILAGKSA